ncbi:MAG: hypothetical protein FWE56_02870 [Candidatus Bathyarchaeota archaeon]|nr:hypothetical protein [Candidatus Termiticorpusculum sp.]MCL2868429.1 hypothetical protein [Candidatus Termiticorpusculum sp.]
MENKMNNNNSGHIRFKIGLLLTIIVLVGLFAAFIAAFMMPAPLPMRPPHPGGHQVIIRYDFELFYLAHAIFSTVNIALLIILLIMFLSVYRKTKSEFSFGLIIFGFTFLLKDIVASPFLPSIFSFYASGLGPFIVLPDLFELVALTVLLYLYIKY